MKLQLTQQIIINDRHKYYVGLDNLCLLAKNLYNVALFHIRQQYFKDKTYLNYNALDKLLSSTKNIDYSAIPYRQSAQQILRNVDKTFKSFFKGIKADKNKGKRLSPPKYKDKQNSRYILTYTNQSFKYKNGIVKLKGIDGAWYEIKTDKQNIQQVRLVPKGNHIVVEIVYNTEYTLKEDNRRYASIDLGLNNIVALTSNVSQSILYNGRPLKAINQHYNKCKAELQSKLKQNKYTSKRINRLTYKRNNKIKDYMHKLSAAIIQYMETNDLNTLIVGKNNGWKNNIEIGKANNQNFVSIPYNVLISMLEYKCKLHGIKMVVVNEAYTSKCSFLDNEAICKHETYLGKRIKRGLFVSNNGIKINADINGSLNIMVLGLQTLKVKRDVLSLEPANQRFVLNPVSISI